MDLIEVLWKQDVDMGFSIEEWQDGASETPEETNSFIKDAEEEEEEGGGSIFDLKNKLKEVPIAEKIPPEKVS